VWWHILRRLRQEGPELKTNLGYIDCQRERTHRITYQQAMVE
jgi:hypothetical protein